MALLRGASGGNAVPRRIVRRGDLRVPGARAARRRPRRRGRRGRARAQAGWPSGYSRLHSAG